MRLDVGDVETEVTRDQRAVERLDMIEEEDVPRLAAKAQDRVGHDLLGVVRIEGPAAPETRMSPAPPLACCKRPQHAKTSYHTAPSLLEPRRLAASATAPIRSRTVVQASVQQTDAIASGDISEMAWTL